MSYLEAVAAALDSLRANPLRTGLTTLGIIFGVAAVIAMVAVGRGAEKRMESVIQRLGANVMVVINGTSVSGAVRRGSGSRPALTTEDARALAEQIPTVRVAAPHIRDSGQVVNGNVNWFTTIRGITDDYLIARDWSIARGREFTQRDERSAAKVVLLGETVVEKLFGAENPIGRQIRIQRVPFTVIGTMRPKGQTGWGYDEDDVVLIPLSTAKLRVLGGRYVRGDFVRAIMVKARSAETLARTERRVTELLRERHRIQPGRPDDFRVRNISSIVEARNASRRTMSFLLAAVAGVSLLVGGIGVMNIMLVSVTERTREIGLRMALGARGRDIMVQFVVEAVALSIAGGVIGIAIGVAGSLMVADIGGWPLVVAPSSIALAAGFSAAVGIFFGYYPALKAARLDPIEALRHE